MKFYVCVTEDRIYSQQASNILVPDKGEYVLGPYGMLYAISMVAKHSHNAKALHRKLTKRKLRKFMYSLVYSRSPPELDRRRSVKQVKDSNPGFENRVKWLEDHHN